VFEPHPDSSIVTRPKRASGARVPLEGLHRRGLLAGALGLAPLLLLGGGGHRPARAEIPLGEPRAFSVEWLREHARTLAADDYRSPAAELPALLAELSYDQHRDIRFRRDAALWRGRDLDAEVQFFHLGHLLRAPVHIFEVADGAAREVLYTPGLFDYGNNQLDAEALPSDLGFAGFRLHVPLNRPDYLDELAAFLGASYFRAVARGQRYGLSARGIAVDTGLPSGEEFPDFRAFWLERPAPGAETFRVHALLDGPGLTGAYSFAITPGTATRMEVRASLFPRRTIDLLGVAPLTSMYLFGANDRFGVDDFRPNVHDSEGLQIWTGRGDWLWRPLANPRRLQLSIFRDENPRGFGLLQRTRDFAAYHDLEARYELRPSLWVEPVGEWGRGQVRLLELPTDEEVHDNVVAFWAPEAPVEAGSEWPLAYRLHWCETPPVRPEEAEVVEMRTGQGGVPGQEREAASRKFVIDFAGGQLDALPQDSGLEAVITASEGELRPPVVQRNEAIGGWRVFFDYLPAGEGPAEFRGFLRLGDQVLSETWVYQWTAG
jgi:periplasmic glucans biosynthesis protein